MKLTLLCLRRSQFCGEMIIGVLHLAVQLAARQNDQLDSESTTISIMLARLRLQVDLHG